MSKQQKPKTGSRKKHQVRSKSGQYATKLTRKQKAFADELLNNPKISNAEAIKRTYNVTDTRTASVMAHENLKNPSILLYMNKHLEKASNAITDFIDLKDSDKLGEKRLAYDSATQVIDRVIGKATQKTEITQQTLKVTIDLSGEE